MATNALTIADRKQLLIDDSLLEERSGAEFTVNRPRKTNEKVLVADRPWEDWMVGAWSTIIQEPGKCRMWYEAYTKDPDEPRTSLCYAESDDGIRWTKPSLGLVSFNGSKDNNIVFPNPPFRSIHGATVFLDPVAPAAERYKMFFTSHEPIPECIYGAFSPDGLRWRRYDAPPLVRTQPDTQNLAFWDDRLNKYVAYVRLCRPLCDPNRVRTVGRAETADFLRWPIADVVLAADERDDDDVDLYNSAAFKYPYADDAYFILTSVYHQRRDRLDIQLATSRDGVQWRRPLREAFIGLGEPGTFDSGCLYATVGRVRRGDELYLYYHGSDKTHDASVKELMHYDGAFSRAVLRLDGFVSLDAQAEATVLTRPLIMQGGRLILNASTRGEGAIQVEICDAAGQPLPGFQRGNCRPWTGDHVAGEHRWDATASLSTLRGVPVRLRIHLRSAKLYAFQFID